MTLGISSNSTILQIYHTHTQTLIKISTCCVRRWSEDCFKRLVLLLLLLPCGGSRHFVWSKSLGQTYPGAFAAPFWTRIGEGGGCGDYHSPLAWSSSFLKNKKGYLLKAALRPPPNTVHFQRSVKSERELHTNMHITPGGTD